MTIFKHLCKRYLYVLTLSVTLLSISACSDESSLSSQITHQKIDGIPITDSIKEPKQYLSSPQNISSDETTKIAEVDYSRGNRIDQDTPVLTELYVINRAGAAGRQLPKDASEKLRGYIFGDKLEVIEDDKEWYGIKAVVHREYADDEGRYVSASQEEKVYIKKSDVGTFDKVILIPEDLNIMSYLNIGEKYVDMVEGKPLDNILQFELIDKALFERKRPLAVNFLSTDKMIKKKNGVLSIQLVKDSVKFVDSDIEGDTEDYRYLGKFDFLDQHLIEVQYWEGHGYKMVDAVEGHLKQEFSDYPYISPNKQYIMAVYANPYDEPHTDLELYRIQDKEITPIMSAGFKNWMPMEEPKDIFWARDGYLYLAVTHSAAFWKENGSFNDASQYIRIKVAL